MDDFRDIENLDDAFHLKPDELGSVIVELEKDGYKVKKAILQDDQMYVCNAEGPVGGLVLSLSEVIYISPRLDHRKEIKKLLRKYIV